MLQMENELLAFEVRHLRARLAAARRELRAERTGASAQRLQKARASLDRVRNARDREREAKKQALRRARRAERRGAKQERAVEDIRWLLGRLSSSPLHPLLKWKKGYRVMLARYLGDKPS